MLFREAQTSDIPAIQRVRNSVKENMLSNPGRITDEDCYEFLFQKGKGWVCVVEGDIVGFSIVDVAGNNIWALFVNPEFEHQGIGKTLHDLMLDWYFIQTKSTVWLGTSPHTRAEQFYRKAGWTEVGMHGTDEIKFEMPYSSWVTGRR